MTKRGHDFGRRKDVTPEMMDVAHRRTDFLFDAMRNYPTNSLRGILASAYLQGIEDAAETMSSPALHTSSPQTPYKG
jgi:hypothetical protein